MTPTANVVGEELAHRKSADRVFAQMAERTIASVTRVHLVARFRLSLAPAAQAAHNKHITAHQQALL